MADIACARRPPNYFLQSGMIASSSSKQLGKNVDPKAVGSPLAHMPLNRRCSIPNFSAADPTPLDPSLGESLELLPRSQMSQNSLFQLSLTTPVNEVKRSHRKLDRSQSEPANRAGNLLSTGPALTNANRYKTELCRPFEENGTCKYGDKCQFAHGYHELRSLTRHPKYKTELCKTYHTVGFCPYGPRCHFIHNADEARTQSPTVGSSTGICRPNKPATFSIFAGSSADSPSPPSSLSESPTSSSGFFLEDQFSSNPFSPTSKNFRFASDFGPALFRGRKGLDSNLFSDYGNLDDFCGVRVMLPGVDSPSLSDSLASDLDSLSLGSNSPPPPTITGPMETSRGLRLPIFSRISERLDEENMR